MKCETYRNISWEEEEEAKGTRQRGLQAQKPRGRERQREEAGRRAARVKSGSNMVVMRNHTGQALVSSPLCQMRRKSTKDVASIDVDRVAFVVLLCFFFY